MNEEAYQNKVKEIEASIMTMRRVNLKTVRALARDLLKLATEHDPVDQKTAGIAYYYLAEYYLFLKPESKQYMSSLMRGVEFQQAVHDNTMLSRSYNLMGIDASNSGNLELAFDYYRLSQDYAEKENGSVEILAIAMYNQGTIFYKMHELKSASEMLKSTLKVTKKLKVGSDYHTLLMTDCYCELGKLAFFMGNKKAADNYMQQFRKFLKGAEEPNDPVFQSFNIFHAHSVKDYMRRDETIKRFLDFVNDKKKMRVDIVEDVLEVVDFLVDLSSFDYAKELISSAEDVVKTSGSAYFKREFARSKINLYKSLGNEKLLKETYEDYFKASEKLQEQSGLSYSKFLDLQKTLTRIVSDNRMLSEKANTDELTGLSNRAHLNTFSDDAFQDAYENKKKLAIELLDIDDFKSYNDRFGHYVGDLCLLALSKELKKILKDERIFAARYGGDEFVIIYKNMEDDEILKIAEKLGNKTRNLKIPVKKRSKETVGFTISQGIHNAVPKKLNRIWDFLHKADIALYDVKKDGKDGVKID